jgi:hypothetical protein
MELGGRSILRCFWDLRHNRRGPGFDPDTIKGPTNEPTEQPVCGAEKNQNAVLSAGEMMTQDINDCNGSTGNAYVDPPQNPSVNPQMNMHGPSLLRLSRRMRNPMTTILG